MLAIALAAVASGCRDGAATIPKGPRVPTVEWCFRSWNVKGNEGNRTRLARSDLRLGTVAVGASQAGGASTVSTGIGYSCSYLFHSRTRFISFEAAWKGGVTDWKQTRALRGPWDPQIQHAADDYAAHGDGTIERR
jgi:hypothetical protein